ncbi:MAG: ATP synthase F1 subunit gamma [Planctomycetota bacterium]|jgi:F-type H+-transporting ATPase subunit gamma|nr:ATP synthase F1 subunit gamma [Planctomycetota bacterium]
MAQIRELKKRMVAVRTIQRITKTMQMIATAKFTAALARAKATRPYTDRIRGLVGEVAAAAGDDFSHPLMKSPATPSGRELVLVVTSDRGLCGAYNGNVLRKGNLAIKALKAAGTTAVVETVGKKAVAYFRFAKVDIAERHTFGDKPQFAQVEALAKRLMADFSAGKFDKVHVVYMRFISNSKQVPEVMQLLPLAAPAAATGGATSSYEFSPSGPELLADLLPKSVVVSLFQAFNDAAVSEHVMRMVSMKAATDNAGALGRTIRRNYNRARQARITTELTEIVSGAAALE